ncbi:MAG: HTTM domain-containing protein [Planctomycetota bacterium]
MPTAGPMRRFREWMATPVDGASLAVFRIGFGLSMAYMAANFLRRSSSGISPVDLYFNSDQYHFSYPYLGWIRPLPEPGTTILFVISAVSSLFVAAGFLYRLAAIVQFFTFNYYWMMEATFHGNHFVLAAVFVALLPFVPANAVYSVDVWLLGSRGGARTVPFWSLFLLRGQVFLVYFFGGISKLNPDWLAGEPIGMWFQSGAVSASAPLLSPPLRNGLQAVLSQELVIYFFSFGGLVFDVVIGFLLMIRRTRLFALGLCVLFHTFNFFMIEHVGIVAPMAFWGTLLFLDPDWPRRLYRWIQQPSVTRPDVGWLIAGLIAVPGVGALLGWSIPPTRPKPDGETAVKPVASWLVLVGIAGWLALQTAIPLRHYFIRSDAHWTDEGAPFSWFLMTRNKVGGFIQYRVDDPAISNPTANNADLDWAQWKGERPEYLIKNVHASRVDWSNFPEFFVTYEPIVGERIFFKVKADDPRTNEEIQAFVDDYWTSRYGRRPRIYATLSLKFCLDQLRQQALRLVKEQKGNGPLFLDTVARSINQAERLQASGSDPDAKRRNYLSLNKNLRSLSRLFPNETMQSLVRVHPFDLQGGTPNDDFRILMITDGDLVDARGESGWRLKRDVWRGEGFDFADLDLMLAEDMEPLPRILVAQETDGRWSIRWNYTRDLNRWQVNYLPMWTYITHQYAHRVADEWQRRFGRRPKVFVTSYLALNQHPLQAIIDPTVDLASVPYLQFQHNDWILPLNRVPPPSRAE